MNEVINVDKLARFEKSYWDEGDYEVRWLHYLAKHNDSIATGTFLPMNHPDNGMFITNILQTSTSMFLWVASGTSHQEYLFRNRITTVGGRTWNRTILVKVIPR